MAGQICVNVTNSEHDKNCLLKYITAPFRQPIIYHRHQNMWQVPMLASVIAEFGYNVDVVDYDDTQTVLNKRYDMVIDIYPQECTIYQHCLKPGCLKILFATGAAPAWQSKREEERLTNLAVRRGVMLPAKAYTPSYPAEITNFDGLLLIGNTVTLSTYSELGIRKKFLIPNAAYDCVEPVLYQKDPSVFLFFATYPSVLKGLDLLLEVFTRDSTMSLIICSQFTAERDFCSIYERELFHCPNILPIGPVDITSELFQKITRTCSYVVLPSCSEGMSGSVLTAMASGLIPVISRETGIDEEDAHLLPDCSLESISGTLRQFANKSKQWVAEESCRTYRITKEKYSPQRFGDTLRASLREIIGN